VDECPGSATWALVGLIHPQLQRGGEDRPRERTPLARYAGAARGLAYKGPAGEPIGDFLGSRGAVEHIGMEL
jgi:hypothetical protein